MARHVGPTGKVFSTDVNPTRLREIADAVRKAGYQNVTVIEGGSAQTNLPEECCDALFMRHVYHHFGDVVGMNASLRSSLKPGGRPAVVDFTPDSGVSAPAGRRDTRKTHGVMPATVIEELKAASFEDVTELAWSSPGYFLIVGRRDGDNLRDYAAATGRQPRTPNEGSPERHGVLDPPGGDAARGVLPSSRALCCARSPIEADAHQRVRAARGLGHDRRAQRARRPDGGQVQR